MKKLLALFSALLIAFMGVWVFQRKTPINRPDEQVEDVENIAWWNNSGEIPTVDAEWVLDPEIPENYIPVPGEDELYMVIDDSGKIVEYRQRSKQEDGSWLWKTVNPDIPEGYEAVEGLKNVYRVKKSDGTYSYYKYLRNDDDTFAFIPVDEKGNIIEENPPKGSQIPNNYKHISGNVYAVYNENGVIIGYKERKTNENGDYYWVDCEKPPETAKTVTNANNNSNGNNSSNGNNNPIYTNAGSNNSNNSSNTGGANQQSGGKIEYSSDGTYVQTETMLTNEEKGGYIITYQTIVTRTYDSSGKLVSTKKDGPKEISRVKSSDSNSSAPNKGAIASTLSAELARVSVGLNYNNSLASEVLTIINAERASAGVSSLSLSSDTDAYRISKIRAADMANENHTDYDSPLYGTLDVMCNTFGVNSTAPVEVLWKTTADKSAQAIASRLQILGNGAFVKASYNAVGISIVSKNGYYYINAILL